MTYDEALQNLRNDAHRAGLGVKTFCVPTEPGDAALRVAAERLRAYLESPACIMPDFDVPDEIWEPFTRALDASPTGGVSHRGETADLVSCASTANRCTLGGKKFL